MAGGESQPTTKLYERPRVTVDDGSGPRENLLYDNDMDK